jgi:hypothetical protein
MPGIGITNPLNPFVGVDKSGFVNARSANRALLRGDGAVVNGRIRDLFATISPILSDSIYGWTVDAQIAGTASIFQNGVIAGLDILRAKVDQVEVAFDPNRGGIYQPGGKFVSLLSEHGILSFWKTKKRAEFSLLACSGIKIQVSGNLCGVVNPPQPAQVGVFQCIS